MAEPIVDGLTEEKYVAVLDSVLANYSLGQRRVFDEYGTFYLYRDVFSTIDDAIFAAIVSEPSGVIDPPEYKTLPNQGLVVQSFYLSTVPILLDPLKDLSSALDEPTLLYYNLSGLLNLPDGSQKEVAIPSQGFFKKIDWSDVFRQV